MADEVENHTIRLLQEMRSEMKEQSNAIQALAFELRETRTDLTQRIDGNTLLLNLIAGVVHNHEERLTNLEQGRA